MEMTSVMYGAGWIRILA